nr:F-box only protein 4 [Ciona intestinalis]|eukprot:XP_002127438.1 F-box only protein 4 [Ciona intestinalis]
MDSVASSTVNPQGSMGLHQNNYSQSINNERTIVHVFKFFRDRYVFKIKDGGLQSKDSDDHDDAMTTTDNEDSPLETIFSINLDDLPYYCKLIVLSKLDASDINHLSMTSKHWRAVCSDQILWRELLYTDMLKWPNIGNKSIPLLSLAEYFKTTNTTAVVCHNGELPNIAYDLYARLCSRNNVNYKALYFHSAYQRVQDHTFIGVKHTSNDVETSINNLSETQDTTLAATQTFPRFLRSLWMRMRSGNGEVIMLGPGMESTNTSKIFSRLLWARPDLLMTVRLLPGSQDGVGSGVELEFKGEKRFNLIALYSGNHRDRAKRSGMDRLRRSNILDAVEQNVGEDTSTFDPYLPAFKLHETVLNFLNKRTETYRLIYVVDATKNQSLQNLSCNRLELKALLDGVRHCEQGRDLNPSSILRRPLLVLCCVDVSTTERISCVEVSSLLDLPAITDRPWFAQDINVSNLNGLENALVWLFKQL